VKDIEDRVNKIFKEIMAQCKAERRAKRDITYDELAKKLDKSSGYANAFESGRTFPSIKTFLRYLIVNNFDVEPLKRLRIPEVLEQGDESNLKRKLCDKVMMLDFEGIEFLSEQMKVLEFLDRRRIKPSRPKK
jgi:transcriptional regulator with XRE-family HTH domain